MSKYHVKLLCLAPLASQEGSTRNMPRTWRTNGQTCRATTHQGHSGVSSHGPTKGLHAPHRCHLGVHPDSSNSGPRSDDRLRQHRHKGKGRKSYKDKPSPQPPLEMPPNPPLPAQGPPRSPPGQQQRWTSIAWSPAAASMQRKRKEIKTRPTEPTTSLRNAHRPSTPRTEAT